MTQPPSDAGATSAGLRRFRFGAGGEGNKDEGGARKFVKLAQTAEEYGYDTFAVPDHLGNQVGPLAALGALTQATSTIRLATSVLANGWRHPALLAKEANTIDVLSRGRLELGIGAGWMKEEFDKAGIEFESPGVRIRRLDEALTVLDAVFPGVEKTEYELGARLFHRTGEVLPDSVLDGCTFTGCKALATSWSMLREPVLAPDPCTWVDCQLSMGSFGGLDLTGARFERCVLTDADFDGAVLREAVVDDCSLAGARLVRVDLREADLRTARDYVVDARDAQLAGLRVDPVGALGLLAPFSVVVE